MTASRRTLIALILLLALPLRTLAAAAMPCCATDAAHAAHATSGMGHHAMAMDDESPTAAQALDHDPHRSTPPSDCFSAAMMASAADHPLVGAARPPTRIADRFDTVAPFITDAPERPPRPFVLAA